MHQCTFSLLILSILCGCKKSEVSKQFSGRWTMTEVSCGFCEAPTFEKGEIIWNFDTTNSKLTVENNSREPKTYLSTGTYDFSIDQTNSKITIESGTMDFRFESNNLIISDKPEVDGPLYRFVTWKK